MEISWKDALHYGSAFVLLGAAGLTEVGVSLPGVTVDPKVAGAAGIGILAAGLKGGWSSGKAAIVGLLIGASMMIGPAARAADMATKAVRYQNAPFATATGSGFYLGVGTEAGVASANVSANNTFAGSLFNNNLNAAGASVDFTVGYIASGCLTAWCKIENTVSYQNIGGAQNGGSINARWRVTQEFDVGAELLQTLGSRLNTQLGVNFPTFTPPNPPGVTGTPRQYIGVALSEIELSGNFFGQGGTDWAVAPGLTGGWLWQTVTPGTGTPNGGALDVSALVDWPQRGITVTNVAGPGAPTVSGHGNLTTEYFARVRYDFAP